MRHVILTCPNHSTLRWNTKEVAISNGHYNGARTLFFNGELIGKPEFYSDRSGIHFRSFRAVPNCGCSTNCLIVAPEDKEIATY